jgi:hypothetical protein
VIVAALLDGLGNTSGTSCSAPTPPSSTDKPPPASAPKHEDVAGYDTKRLYISAHGAIGALTALIFKIAVES